ncbi:MAG: hypothetical protein JRN15_24220 [Nitrososphaerota archaeon]|nr:hypothetical protein [Nitrososphaerota archaeon]
MGPGSGVGGGIGTGVVGEGVAGGEPGTIGAAENAVVAASKAADARTSLPLCQNEAMVE